MCMCVYFNICSMLLYVHMSMSSLLVYSSGLFPLLAHGSTSVRSSLLDIYERYYLAVGRGLVPCLPGMVLGLLPGLEDESEHTERYLLCIWVHVHVMHVDMVTLRTNTSHTSDRGATLICGTDKASLCVLCLCKIPEYACSFVCWKSPVHKTCWKL